MSIRFDGADLSHHNADAGPIDWPTLRSASWWVATKATQGLAYVDPTFTAHRQQMAAQGFTHRLYYGWLSANVDPVAQANFYLATIGALTKGAGCMIDAEEGGITAAGVIAWCETVEAVTRRPVAVYTGAYTAGGTIWQNTQIRTSPFGPRPMHLAAYTTEAKAKALPGVAAYPWSAWQYSSDGPVPGVVGRCDMNRVDVVAHYDLACGVASFPPPHPDNGPTPQEDDVITEADIYKDQDTPGDKYVLLREGFFRPVSAVELGLLGIPLTLELGKPVSKADRDTMAALVPAPVASIPAMHIAADIDTATWHVSGSIG